jgi:DNA polymerase-3 subunit epsilon
MNFAIVDIETTGGFAAANGITEVSIQIYDGKNIIRQYETLINPGQQIPYYIRGLTGISDAMVAKAPSFSEVAKEIFDALQGNVFVAHSVNFDYSFLKHALAACGFELELKKLCTIRLSRKIFPGLPSYGLGNLCAALGIQIQNRHRAGGDAKATVKLFELLLENDKEDVIGRFLKRNSKEHVLPPNLPRAQFDALPEEAGVYYFHNQKGKIIYVGKAKNIRKRISSHFSNNSPNKQKQDFMRTVYNISYEVCGNELMAMILESHQIKHLWPEHNRSQKRFEPVFGIIEYQDQLGFKRIGIEKMRSISRPIIAFSNYVDGHNLIRKMIDEFELCPRLVGVATDVSTCETKGCDCQAKNKRSISKHNKKLDSAIEAIRKNESFVIVERGREENEVALVLVDNGAFKKMGYLPERTFRRSILIKMHLKI